MLAFVIGVLGWVLVAGWCLVVGVVARLWAGVVGRVRALVSGVGAWGLVLVGLVGVGWPGWCGGVGGVSGLRVAGVCACARVRLPRVSCCFVWV